MRSLPLLLALLVVQDVDGWIAKLGDERIEVRDEAAAALRKAGAPALPKLRAALEKAAERELKARLQGLVATIERDALLASLTWELVPPKDGLDLATATGDGDCLVLRISNAGDKTVVVPAWATLAIRDAAGAEVDSHMYLGKFGVREGCLLKAFAFREIPAKGSVELRFGLKNYGLDPEAMTGWILPKAGEYSLAFSLKFARAEFIARCPDGCRTHGAAERPWNKSVELERSFTAKLVVKD